MHVSRQIAYTAEKGTSDSGKKPFRKIRNCLAAGIILATTIGGCRTTFDTILETRRSSETVGKTQEKSDTKLVRLTLGDFKLVVTTDGLSEMEKRTQELHRHKYKDENTDIVSFSAAHGRYTITLKFDPPKRRQQYWVADPLELMIARNVEPTGYYTMKLMKLGNTYLNLKGQTPYYGKILLNLSDNKHIEIIVAPVQIDKQVSAGTPIEYIVLW